MSVLPEPTWNAACIKASRSPALAARRRTPSVKTQSPRLVRDHLRCLAVLCVSLLCRTWLPYVFVGAVNRVFPSLCSVFFCYAGNARYASHYSYGWSKSLLLWFPSPIGLFRQGGRWGLICASPMSESEFTVPDNANRLNLLVRRLIRVQELIGVSQISFAGILPSVLRDDFPELFNGPDRTSEVVCAAVQSILRQNFQDKEHEIVLLGGAGRIGRAVRTRLKAEGLTVRVIDSAKFSESAGTDFGSKSILMVDVSRRGAIAHYIDSLPEGSTILNEVFPEPDPIVIQSVRARKLQAFHICGVEAAVYPRLPLGYKNALPCCAIHAPEIGAPVMVQLA